MATTKVKTSALDGTGKQTMARSGSITQVCPVINPSGVTGSETILYVCREPSGSGNNGELWLHDGSSWTIRDLGAGESPQRIQSVPGTPATIYILRFDWSTFAITVKKSTDYGATLNDIGAPSFGDSFHSIAVGSDGYCYASGGGFSTSDSGIWKSNGGSWTQVLEGDYNGFGYGAPANMCISTDEVLWMEAGTGSAYRITAGGSQETLTDPDATTWAGICKGTNGTLIALMDDGSAGNVYRSTDDGANWTLEQTETLMRATGITLITPGIQQDPRAPSTWWLLGQPNLTAEPGATKPHVWKSTDDGQTWSELTTLAGTDASNPRFASSLWAAP